MPPVGEVLHCLLKCPRTLHADGTLTVRLRPRPQGNGLRDAAEPTSGKIVHVIDDSDIVADLQRAEPRHVWPGGVNELDYAIGDVRCEDGVLDFEIAQRDGATARLQIDLPSTGRPQPWLHSQPTDHDDWTQQLLIWLDEEVFTAGLGPSRTREFRFGASYATAETYGLGLADPAEHARLIIAAGPLGWHNISLEKP